MEQFLLFGDSLTQQCFSQERGFVFGAALSNEYVRRLDVVNRGLSGYNTKQGLQMLPRAITSPAEAKVRFMTFWFGANDARLPDTPGGPQQHVPLESYKENTRLMLTHRDVLAHNGIRRILITPPPVDERMTLQSDKQRDPTCLDVIRRKAAVTAQYAEVVRELGKDLGIEVLDLWSVLIHLSGGSPSDPEPVGSISRPQNETIQGFLHDGLHLAPKGYQVLFTEMMELISKKWPDQMPDRLPFVLPAWDNGEAWSSQA